MNTELLTTEVMYVWRMALWQLCTLLNRLAMVGCSVFLLSCPFSGTLRTGSNLLTLPRECAEIIIYCTEKANGSVK